MVLRSVVRGLVILRAFLSGLAHATSSTGENDRGLSFIPRETKHNIVLTSARSDHLTVDLELWGQGPYRLQRPTTS